MTAHPPGWEPVRLDQITEVRLGRQRSPKNHAGTQMRPYLRAANIKWGGVDVSNVKEMNFTDDEVDTYRLQDGDVLLSEASGSAKEVGKPGVWRGQTHGAVCFQNTLIRVRPETGIDSEFLYYRFLHEALRGGFVEASRGVGIHHLGAAKLASLEVALPPTAQQQRIARALSSHLSLMQLAERDHAALGRRLRRLTDAVLNDVVQRAAREVETFTPVGDVCSIGGGIQKHPRRYPTSDDPGVPFLRVANVGRRALHLDDVHRIVISDDERGRVLLEAGDLLVVEGNGSPEQIGRASLWQGAVNPTTHQNHLVRVRPSEQLLPEFLELAWNAPTTAETIKNVASTTSGLYTLSAGKVAGVRVPVPPTSVQRDLVVRAHAELELVTATQEGLASLRQPLEAMRRSLLHAAFSGDLLPSSPTDPSVRLLLQEIQQRRSARVASKRTARRARAPRAEKTQETSA